MWPMGDWRQMAADSNNAPSPSRAKGLEALLVQEEASE